MINHQVIVAGLIMLLLAPATRATGQQEVLKTGAKALVARLVSSKDPVERGKAYSDLRMALQQENATVSRGKLDSIADGLLALATRGRDDVSNNATDAVALIGAAGAAKASRPYPGSFDRLIRISETAPDVGIRAAALGTLYKLADRSRAVAYLEAVATSGPPRTEAEVTAAIKYLSTQFGDEGRSRLARIDRESKVKYPEPRAWLRSLKSSGYGSRSQKEL